VRVSSAWRWVTSRWPPQPASPADHSFSRRDAMLRSPGLSHLLAHGKELTDESACLSRQAVDGKEERGGRLPVSRYGSTCIRARPPINSSCETSRPPPFALPASGFANNGQSAPERALTDHMPLASISPIVCRQADGHRVRHGAMIAQRRSFRRL